MDSKNKILNILRDRPGMTFSSLCRLVPRLKKYKVQQIINEMVGAGMLHPRAKGSHDGLVLTKEGAEAAEGGTIL